MGLNGPFDGFRECECVEGLWVCKDHVVYSFEVETIEGREYMRPRGLYEMRHELEGELYIYGGLEDSIA